MKDHTVSMSCQSLLVRAVDPATENLSHNSIVLVRLLRLASASTVGCVYLVATAHEKRASTALRALTSRVDPVHLTRRMSVALCRSIISGASGCVDYLLDPANDPDLKACLRSRLICPVHADNVSFFHCDSHTTDPINMLIHG